MTDLGLETVFHEIAALILLAVALGLLGLLARQPLVVAFIAAGILAGPDALGLLSSAGFVETLSQISIAVLLFLVGLKLDVGLVRNLGRVAVATGLGQVGFTAVVGFAICLALGIGWLEGLYVSVALTFSSTIIIVKLLSDKGEIEALHGKIALGFLIVQDIFVVLAMVVLSTIGIGAAGGGNGLWEIVQVLGGGLLLMAALALFVRYGAEPLLGLISRSAELLVIFAVGWAAATAAVADAVGLGKELGGLLAGVSLASTQFREAIGARLTSLRDFLLLFFFLHLGGTLDLSALGAQVVPALVLSIFVLVGNPLIVMAIMGYMGYRKRTGFLAGLTVAQISEFSLIFVAMGLAIGHVNEDALGLVTLVGLVTIALSVYMITWSHHLYRLLEPLLGVFERRNPFREAAHDSGPVRRHDFIVFGLGRFGRRIGEGLSERGFRVLGVDFDPDALRKWCADGFDGRFGDATDPDFLGHMPLGGVRAVISTVPRNGGPLTEADPHLAILHGLRTAGYGGDVVLTANNHEVAERLLAEGATRVLTPYDDAASHAVGLIAEL